MHWNKRKKVLVNRGGEVVSLHREDRKRGSEKKDLDNFTSLWNFQRLLNEMLFIREKILQIFLLSAAQDFMFSLL